MIKAYRDKALKELFSQNIYKVTFRPKVILKEFWYLFV